MNKNIRKIILFYIFILITFAVNSLAEKANTDLIKIYSPYTQKEYVEYLKKSSNLLLVEVMELYKFSIKDGINIVVTKDAEEFKKLISPDMPPWVAGIALIRPDRIIISGNLIYRFPDDIRNIIHHELSHIVLEEKFAVKGIRPPRWLDEGLAVYVSKSWDLDYLWEESNIKILYKAAHENRIFLFSSLSYSFPADEESVKIAYAQSYSFINYLVSKYSLKKLITFIDYLSNGKDLESSSQEIFTASFSNLEKDWYLNFKSRKILFPLIFGTSNFYNILWSLLGIMVIVIFFRRMVFKKKNKVDEEEYEENEKGW